MLNQLLPQSFDNHYRGSKVALWLFGALLFVRIAMSLNSIFNGYSVATAADGIPLDAFPPAATRTVIFLFAAWGLAHLIISLLGVLALVRYRSMVPLIFTLLLIEFLSRKLIHTFVPTVSVGTPPAVFVNLFLLVLLLTGSSLSLWTHRSSQLQE